MRATAKLIGILSLLAALVASCLATDLLTLTGNVQVGSNYVDFGTSPSNFLAAPGYGSCTVSAASGLYQTLGITPGTVGEIQSLDGATGKVTLPSPFLEFNGPLARYQFIATDIPVGNNGPFQATDNGNGTSTLSFAVNGYIQDTAANKQIGNFSLGFAMNFGYPVAQLFTKLPLNTTYNPPASDFAVSVTPNSQTVPAGSTATYTVQVAASGTSNTFNNPVALSVAGLPGNTASSFTPTSVTPGSKSASSTLKIIIGVSPRAAGMVGSNRNLWLGGSILALVGLLCLRPRRFCPSGARVISCGLCGLALAGCGGGGGSVPTQGTSNFNLTITGTSGTTVHSTAAVLSVAL